MKNKNVVLWIITILFFNSFNAYPQLGCGAPPFPPPNPPASTNCSRASAAFNARYVQMASYEPDASDNVKTIKISINIFQDPGGGGSFTSNTADPDYQWQRVYLTQTLPGWINGQYSNNGSLDIWAGQSSPTSDPLVGVLNIQNTKVRFDLGDPGQERIYYYPGNLWNVNNLTGFQNTIYADGSRQDQHNTLNLFFTEVTGTGIGGYASPPNYNDTWDQYVVCMQPYATYYFGGAGIGQFGHPDYQSARTLVHELGHILDLWHTYDAAGGGDPCQNGVDYLDDVFGTYPPPICPFHDCADPYSSPNDGCTNNIMANQLNPCYFSPKQIGRLHRTLALKTSRKYLKECVYNTQPLSVTNSEVWDFDFQNDRDVIIDNNSTLEITCKLSMPNGSKIIVNPGSTLIIDGIVTNNCDGAWDGLIDVKENATLHLKGDAEVHLKGNGKIFIEGNTSGDATMIYDAGADIFLENINTHIEIQGNLQLTDNANFTFNYSGNAHGYVKFSSTHPLPLNVQAGINCSMSFVGSNQILKVLEVDQEGLYPPSNLVNFTVQDGTIRLHSGDRILPLGWSTFVTLSNARVTSHINGVNNNHLGFQMVGQSHLLSNTIFEYGDYGLHYVGTLGRNDLQAWNCTFKNCMEGLYTDDKGVELHSCYFSSNETGWNTGSMSNPSMADQGTVGGSIASANIKGYFYNSLNSAPLTIKDPNITYNTDIGVEVGRTVVGISCGTISYNTSFGIAIGKAATLKMDNGANVTCVGNGVTVGLSFANYIYLYNGVNDLMPVVPQSQTAVAGTLISPAPPILADKNNWNGGGFSLADYNITYNAVPVIMNDNSPVYPVMPCGQANPPPPPAPGQNDPLTNCNDCDFITTEDFTNERLNEATQEAIERAEDNSGNNYVEAVDLFSQILMEDYINPTNKEKYLLGMNYLEMLGALGNAFKSGQLTWQMNTVSLDSSIQKVVGVLNKLIDFAITNNDYTARLSYSLDKAAVYRMADRRDLAIALLNSVGSWVQQDDADELVRLNCIYSAEQQAVLGQIETYDLYYALSNCGASQTLRRANPSANTNSNKAEAELEIEIFPNPASSDLTVITNIEHGSEILMNAMGQKVYTGEFANEHLIDVSGLANGIYSLEIKDSDSGKKIIRRISVH